MQRLINKNNTGGKYLWGSKTLAASLYTLNGTEISFPLSFAHASYWGCSMAPDPQPTSILHPWHCVATGKPTTSWTLACLALVSVAARDAVGIERRKNIRHPHISAWAKATRHAISCNVTMVISVRTKHHDGSYSCGYEPKLTSKILICPLNNTRVCE